MVKKTTKTDEHKLLGAIAEVKELLKGVTAKAKGVESEGRRLGGIMEKELKHLWALCQSELFVWKELDIHKANLARRNAEDLKAHEKKQ